MKTTALMLLAMCGMLRGQNVVYQQAGAIGVTSGGAIAGFGIPFTGRSVTGSPFSGTEQRHSLQVLGDGTRIERNDTSQISRDSEGRVRMETMPANGEGRAMVTIQDPVAGVTYLLDPTQKTANKMPMPSGKGVSSLSPIPPPGGPVFFSATGTGPGPIVINRVPVEKGAGAPAEESLEAQSINGVTAKGTRTTIDIPAGQIGNDRAFQVVNERWYSDDLQMVVKSSNSDPRFGTTTYELTNINRAEPDPTLFQIPADYTVKEGNAVFNTIQTK
jgi:hypothetical protein